MSFKVSYRACTEKSPGLAGVLGCLVPYIYSFIGEEGALGISEVKY